MVFGDVVKKGSGSIAKDRLKLVLITDRINCSPQVIAQMKDDIYNVVSKYVEISNNEYSISIINSCSHQDNVTLPQIVAKIPIIQKNSGEQYV